MAWNKGQFRTDVYNWFSSLKADNEDATATLIGNSYHSASANTVPTQLQTLPKELKGPGLIINGFKTSFASCRSLETSASVSNWTAAAQGVADYWANVEFDIKPIPPGVAAGIKNIVVDTGAVSALAQDIFNAFSSNSPEQAADRLTQAMVNHLLTIKGNFSGAGPGTPPPPVAIPWVSLE